MTRGPVGAFGGPNGASRRSLRVVHVVAAGALGAAVAAGGRWYALAVALAVAPAVILIAGRRRTAPRSRVLSVELPVLLLLVSNLTFRIRDSGSLAANPIDGAGILRAGLQAVALLLALLALVSRGEPKIALASRPFRLYAAYALWALLGITASVLPLLTAYRIGELLVAIIVLLAAMHAGGPEASVRLERLLYAWVVAILAIVWMNVLTFPGEALARIDSPIPLQIRSIVPAMASNSVGAFGVILCLWSLARLAPSRRNDWPGRKVTAILAGFGFATLVAAQYRTGYVALAAGLVVLLVFRKKLALAFLALTIGITASVAGPAIASGAEPFVLRGSTPQAAMRLSGRVNWWTLAIPVWETSPVYGTGLVTGTRFEVLEANGFGETNTIHSTWIEALVGTGLVGLALLASALLVAWWRALRRAGQRRDFVPAVLLAVLTVRSFTGATFESFHFASLTFLWIALSLRDDPREMPEEIL